ncbi:MAG: UdgX family uracil-DNA binding protein [Tatlockia sp.]|nr:UdgX family uracil-DNA binding protein [Tatlockia sp.]
MYTVSVDDFSDWRDKARKLLQQEIEPALLLWQDTKSSQALLFQEDLFLLKALNENNKNKVLLIPKKFLPFAATIALHRSTSKWEKLYQLLWRLTHNDKRLLEISSDPLMHELLLMYKAIRRDAHKMKAFIRFCKFKDENEHEYFLAWYKPDHLILRLVAPFFKRRFEVMHWIIVTADETVSWNGQELIYSEGRIIKDNPTDGLEDLWQTYYKAIFNPARIKIKAMKREMPVRFWHNLPETRMISTLLKEAPKRVETMMLHQEGLATSALDFLPKELGLLSEIKQHAKQCQGCPLYRNANQTVFGAGNPAAKLILVGEQPGDQEDLTGEPFVGPAGQLLNEILFKLSIKRENIYLSNAVKHFKYTLNGNFRLHRSPSIHEINACKPWLLKEIELIKPKVVLCLGLTAARSLINPAFSIKRERGLLKPTANYFLGATFHPSAVLRAPTLEAQEKLVKDFERDILQAFLLSETTEV